MTNIYVLPQKSRFPLGSLYVTASIDSPGGTHGNTSSTNVSPVTTATAASASSAELAAYAALSLLNLACRLLNRQIAAPAEFLKTKAVSRSGLVACAARVENKADSFQPL